MNKREQDEAAKAAKDKAAADGKEMDELRAKSKAAWAESEAQTSGSAKAHETAQEEASGARAKAAGAIHEDMMAARKAAMEAAARLKGEPPAKTPGSR